VAVARPSGDERAGQIQTDLLLSCDALLMGRCTYDASRRSDRRAPAVGFRPADVTRLSDGIVILSYQTDELLPRGGADA
jgi:hypothetical protein